MDDEAAPAGAWLREMSGNELGLWLAAFGALILLVERFFVPHQPSAGLRFSSPESERGPRISFAMQAVGLTLAAIGSTVVILSGPPRVWVVGVTVAVVAIGFWILLAWTQRRDRLMRRSELLERLHDEGANALMAWQAERATELSSWRWALAHPFEGGTWGGQSTRPSQTEGNVPEVFTAHQLGDLQNWAKLTEDMAIPEHLRDVVAAALANGFELKTTAALLVFYDPNGRNPVAVEREAGDPLTRVLSRQRFVEELRALGLPTDRTIKGQVPLMPDGSPAWTALTVRGMPGDP